MVEKKKSIPISDFQKQCRMLFSSLSMRGCTYLYVNLPGRENELVITNGAPDLLLTYSSLAMVAVHHIKPKDDFIKQFKKLFLSSANPTDCYLIKTEYITRAFKDHRVETVLCQVDPATGDLKIAGGGQLVSINATDASDVDDDDDDSSEDWSFKDELERLLEDDGWDAEVKRAVFGNRDVAGLRFADPFVLGILEGILEKMENHHDTCVKYAGNGVLSFDEASVENPTRVHSNWYRSITYDGRDLNIDTDAEYLKQRHLFIDGLDLPSTKEFIKKKYKKGVFVGTFRMYIFHVGGNSVQQLAYYDADDVTILSTRPFMSTVLVPSRSKKETHRHLKSLEEVYGES